jgi:hypothetical protein
LIRYKLFATTDAGLDWSIFAILDIDTAIVSP